MYKEDLALNNPQGLICLKTKPKHKVYNFSVLLNCSTFFSKFDLINFLNTDIHN